MGWIFSIFFIISGCITKDINHFYVAAIFSIAGSISNMNLTIERKEK